MSNSPPVSPPSKRVKLDITTPTPVPTEAVSQIELERVVGITEYVGSDISGWGGILKQRYTDFLVNEIDEQGTVMHLTELTADGGLKAEKEKVKKEMVKEEKVMAAPHIPEPNAIVVPAEEKKEFELSPEDMKALSDIVTPEIAAGCISLYRAIIASSPLPSTTLLTPAIEPKSARSSLHGMIRNLFSSRLETNTLTGEQENQIHIKPSKASSRNNNNRQHRGNRGGANQKAPATKAAERGGDYCHFLLYKENRDTMHALKIVQKLLGLRMQSAIGFAGTKDKRAVTVQRCSVYRVDAARLAKLNFGDRGLHPGTRVGNFVYKTYGLELGDLGGNEFVITLRECAVASNETRSLEEVVSETVARVRRNGFVNYFGLQRFGSYSTGTWEVGVKLLSNDWKGAVSTILAYDSKLLTAPADNDNRDDRTRAEACAAFEKGEYKKATELIPWKYSAESAVMKFFAAKSASNDYLSSLAGIPRSLKTMYSHAYQSYVWNYVVSARVRMGLNVMAGDLVLIPQADATTVDATEDAEVDQAGEVIVNAPITTSARPRAKEDFQRARALSAEEAASGKWTIRDVVLPTPGWDVVYPQNELMDVYRSIMKKHGLDPEKMKRGNKEFSLPGSYRKIVAGFLQDRCEFEVRRYKGLEQVAKTDMDILNEKNGKQVQAQEVKEEATPKNEEGMALDTSDPEEEKTAVVLKLCLGISTYATMALREFMREGIRAYKPEFGR